MKCILNGEIVAFYLKYWLNGKTPKWNIVSKISDYSAPAKCLRSSGINAFAMESF